MDVNLYRGLTLVPESACEVIERIRTHGIDGSEGRWRFELPADMAATQSRAGQSLGVPASFKSVSDGPIGFGICACGTLAGAAYYAVEHNVVRCEGKTLPVLISFRASVDRMFIDGRDFLIPAFQRFDLHANTYIDVQRHMLERLFGSAISPYFDKCVATKDQQERITLAKMSLFDLDSILFHLENKIVLGGRHGVRFHSAFVVSAPVHPCEIVAVGRGDVSPIGAAAYTIDDFVDGRAV